MNNQRIELECTDAILSAKHHTPETSKNLLSTSLKIVNVDKRKPIDMDLAQCVPSRKIIVRVINTAYPYVSRYRSTLLELAHRVTHNAEQRRLRIQALVRGMADSYKFHHPSK